ncbi:glycosyltransferase [Hymenobacter sp. BT559]|uniref:glycosyltransferase n=1 Tax=Hymenobacter sp. BT559 TaxID=2795729 RepID=UPI001AAD8257|nr:glycosyltransferase [Hymenobacter sp. BT559]
MPAPLAVLVLAWDEAAPAVRALVAATQVPAPAVDSILVMVPQADAPNHLSAEEYLPLALPEPAAQAPEAVHPSELAPALVETPPPAPAATALLRAEALEEDAEPAADELLLPSPAVALAPAAAPDLGWATVRVLRLGSHSLPQLARLAGRPLPAPIWLGAALPAAPYVGATPHIASAAEPLAAPGSSLATQWPAAPLSSIASEQFLPTITALAAPEIAAGQLPAATTSAEPMLQAAALETDLPPSTADEPEVVELVSPDLAPPEEAPLLPEQASWPEALAALRQPVAPSAPAPTAPSEPAPDGAATASPAHAALLPAAQHYPAPDLNFQIIQYARFAVPVALAEPTYEVIYAPAWPTWLAAQELRQRTGRLLVLHVAALAAPADESAETATGWVAELQRQALRRADLVLTETTTLAERLHHELGLAAGAVRVVPATATEAIAQALHEARPRPA